MSGAIRRNLGLVVALCGVTLLHGLVLSSLNSYYASILIFTAINVMLAVSLSIVNGLTGQFSLGHAGFMAVGAYVSAWLTLTLRVSVGELLPVLQHVFFLLSLFVGGLMAGVVGLLVGIPTLRLRGDYLAIVTLGFGEIIRVLLLTTEAVGGARGMPGIIPPPVVLAPWGYPILSLFGWVSVFAMVTYVGVLRIKYSPLGRAFLSIREDEIAAESLGVNTTALKVKAFVLGAFVAGVAGGLFAHQLMFINPSVFDFNRSIEIVSMVVLGGAGSISGAALAAFLLTLLREALREVQAFTGYDYRMIIYAVLLIGFMLLRPRGLFGTKEVSEVLQGKGRHT